MPCPVCDADRDPVAFGVPAEFRERAPEAAAAAAICPRCLTVRAAAEPAGEPDFSRVSDAFPRGDAAVPFALALGLCSSLATNRAAIETLFEAVERAGADPLLAIDRLVADPDVDPDIDLERRRHQLAQLLE